MARLTMSPIVSGISGKAADGVYASWKGRQYVRKMVVPHNPQSDAQTAVREAMARMGPLWRSLPAVLQDRCNQYAAGIQMSGWNWFVMHNRKLELTNEAGNVCPPDSACLPLATLSLATGAAAGQIAATFTCFSDETSLKVQGLVRQLGATPAAAAAQYSTAFVWDSKTVADSPITISGLTNSKVYLVTLFTSTTIEGVEYYGAPLYGTATAHAA